MHLQGSEMVHMKYLLSGALVVLIAAAVFSHKTYKVERTINAPPEVAWDVLMDTVSYGGWNPVFIKVVVSIGRIDNRFSQSLLHFRRTALVNSNPLSNFSSDHLFRGRP